MRPIAANCLSFCNSRHIGSRNRPAVVPYDAAVPASIAESWYLRCDCIKEGFMQWLFGGPGAILVDVSAVLVACEPVEPYIHSGHHSQYCDVT